MTETLALALIQIAITQGPGIAADVGRLLQKKDATLDEWIAVFDRASGKVLADGQIQLGKA